MSADLYVAELAAYDPATAGIVRLRYATQGFVTGPADTPPHAFYDGRLEQPAVMRRDLFAGGTTSGRSRVSYGDLVLANGDGLLDALLTYGFDGRSVTIRRGTMGAAYPGGFTMIAELTAEQVEATQDAVTVKIRDRQLELEIPLQPTKYAGDNVLPDGLEGVAADLRGKPKPRCFGTVKNVPAVLVNTAKLIYQVNDGPIASLDAVYDKGIRLAGGSWPTASLLGSAFDTVHGCCFGNGLYVIVGLDGGVSSRISTSPDGVNWTVRTGAAENANGEWRSVIWVEELGLFVAVGGKVGPDDACATSPDGTTWTARTIGMTGANIATGVAWGATPALLVAVGQTGMLFTSPDGSAWTSRTSGTANNLNNVTYASGIFVVTGQNGTVLTSPDGITWTARTNSFGGAANVRGVAFGEPIGKGGLFVGVGDGGVLITSDDGVDWAATRLTGISTTIFNVAFAEGIFLAVGDIGVLLNSPDGITWTARTPGFGATAIRDACQGAAGWLIVGDGGKYGLNSYGTYADAAELEDDTLEPAPGEVKIWLDGGYFRLGSSPAGLVTADVTEGTVAGDRTAGQLFARLLSDPLGAPLVEFSSADIAALDTANAAVLGLWVAEEMTVAEALDLMAESVGAWWGVNRSGVLRIQQFTAPAGSPLLAFTANDLKQPLARIPVTDPTRGLPTWRSILRHTRNYAVQDTDLAAGVTDDRRAFVAKEWREATAEDAAVQAVHPLAPQTLEDSLLAVAANAETEATRRQALRGVLRDRYEITVPLTSETEVLDLGDVVTLTHSRYGLGAGPLFRALGIEPDVQQRSLTLQLWR